MPNDDIDYFENCADITHEDLAQIVPDVPDVTLGSEPPSTRSKRQCVAPGCTSKDTDGDVMFHRFPPNEERLTLWLSQFPNVPWTYCKSARLCSKHFEPSCYKQVSSDSNSRRKKPGTEKPLKRPQHTDDATPTIWPNVATELLKSGTTTKPRPTKLSSASSRRDSVEEMQKEKDRLSDIDKLFTADLRIPPGCIRIADDSGVIFMKTIVAEKPKIHYCLKVFHSLQYEIWLEDNKMSLSELLPGTEVSNTLESLSIVQKIIVSLDERSKNTDDSSVEKGTTSLDTSAGA